MTQKTTTGYTAGQQLPGLSRRLSQEKINRYAGVSRDHNPLHIDPEFAATTRFGGPVAHGMLVLACVSELMTAAFGEAWLRSGRMKARFRGPARPGDTVTVRGRVLSVNGPRIACEIEARNQADEILISADAEVEP